MTTVRASDGVSLYAEAHGDGTPIVLSCGYATTCENFRPQVAPLLAAGARVVLWDYRGHGRSGAPKDPDAYSMARVLDDLGRVVDWAAPHDRAVLAGFSFGGLASLHFALGRPDRVRGLILLASGPGFKKAEAQARWQAQVERTASLLERGGFAAFLAGRAAETAVGRRREQAWTRAAAEAIGRQDAQAVAQFGRRVAGPVPGVIDELGRIDVPTWVVVGEEDSAYTRAAEVMAARLPRAKQVCIPAAGHVLTLEQPEAIGTVLVDFLRALPPGP